MEFMRRMLARNFAQPTDTPLGRLAIKIMVRRNSYLEKNAVRHLNIHPRENVLEVGFGHGLGLKLASEKVETGKLFGVDISDLSHQKATTLLSDEIKQMKVQLYKSSVESIPLNNDSIDKVFHCNSFYFWPDILAGCSELFRVMKPGGLMLTVQNIARVLEKKKAGGLHDANTDFVAYMQTLEHAGFTNVKVDYYTDEETELEYQCIQAIATKNLN